jgi:Asp-tRNA(Asn)/Glu-tRNA(Gln) amidotransferase C subunit
MENVIKLYEEHIEKLMNQHEDIMNTLKPLNDVEASRDAELREFVSDLMELATYVSSCITVIEYKIKILKRMIEEA